MVYRLCAPEIGVAGDVTVSLDALGSSVFDGSPRVAGGAPSFPVFLLDRFSKVFAGKVNFDLYSIYDGLV